MAKGDRKPEKDLIKRALKRSTSYSQLGRRWLQSDLPTPRLSANLSEHPDELGQDLRKIVIQQLAARLKDPQVLPDEKKRLSLLQVKWVEGKSWKRLAAEKGRDARGLRGWEDEGLTILESWVRRDLGQRFSKPPADDLASLPGEQSELDLYVANLMETFRDSASRACDLRLMVLGEHVDWAALHRLGSRLRTQEVPEAGLGRELAHLNVSELPPALSRGNLPDRLLILAPPGAGKTTALKVTAFECSRAVTEDAHSRVPIFVTLSDYLSQDGVIDFVTTRTADSGLSAAALRHLLESGRLLFLFDGLNEIPMSGRTTKLAWLNTFAQTWHDRGNAFVFTCRASDYVGGVDAEVLVLDALDDDGIRSLISLYVRSDQKAKQFFSHLRNDPILWDLAHNPQILSMMCDRPEEFRQGTGFAGLLERFIDGLIEREQTRAGQDSYGDAIGRKAKLPLKLRNIKDALAAMAIDSARGGELGSSIALGCVIDVVGGFRNPSEPDPDYGFDIVRAGIGAGLLSFDSTALTVRFSHESFQEFFAAWFLARVEPGDQKDLELLLRYPACEEIAALLTELVDDASAFIQMISKFDLALAARCTAGANKVNRRTRNQLFEDLVAMLRSRLTWQRWDAEEGLAWLGGKDSIEQLVHCGETGSFEGKWPLVWAAQVHPNDVWPAVSELVTNQDVALRIVGADVLGWLQHTGAQELLLKLSSDRSPRVRARALESLGDRSQLLGEVMGREVVTRWIAPRLLDSNDNVAANAANVLLLSRGSEETEDWLLQALEKSGHLPFNEYPLNQVLPSLRFEELSDAVLRAFKGGTLELSEASWAIGCSHGGTERLVSWSLDHPDNDIRVLARHALWHRANENIWKAVTTLLFDRDPGARSDGAAILAKMFQENPGAKPEAGIVERLITLLSDSSEEVRQQSALALAEVGRPEAECHLLQIVTDADQPAALRAAFFRALPKVAGESSKARLNELIRTRGYAATEAYKAVIEISQRHRVFEDSSAVGFDLFERLLQVREGYRRHEIVTQLATLPPKTLESLLSRALRRSRTRQGALELIAASNLITLHDDVVELTSNSSVAVREESALALGTIGNTDDLELLDSMLQDPERRVRDSAYLAIGQVLGRANLPKPVYNSPNQARKGSSEPLK